MNNPAYHHYLFFELHAGFYQAATTLQSQAKASLRQCLEAQVGLLITPYSTLGMKAGTTLMLWTQADDPADVQTMLTALRRTKMGQWLSLTQSFFGIVRPSVYSGRTGKPEQVIQNFSDRLPYLILYPFTKTHDWYQLDQANRGSIMGQHIKIGLDFPSIRQCLLYSYGLDDNEFLVSYETESLEDFQDLIIRMRATIGRPYTLSDTPIYTCIYRSIDDLIAWL